MGHYISGQGLEPIPEKLQSLQEMPPPTDLTETRKFLGFVGYYRKFIPKYSDIARPLTNLTRKDIPFEWSKACQAAFEMLKEYLLKEPILKYPKPDQPYILYTDASKYAWAGVLTQAYVYKEEGREFSIHHPITYVSGLFKGPQLNWAALTKEAYAIYMVARKLDYYLREAETTIRSDHLPLKSFLLKNTKNDKVNNWGVELASKYTLNFEYVKGVKNTLADTMSRLVTLDPDIKLVKEPEGYQFGKQIGLNDDVAETEVRLISLAPVAPVSKSGKPVDPIPDKDILQWGVSPEEIRYLTQLLSELAAWDPVNNTTQRKKRFIPLFASIGAAIGSIVNAGQIKKIKKNIAILQEATILQDQQIMELARYADLTAAHVRLHDTQIYRLQYGLLIVEDGLREMIDVSNFQIYTSYHVSIALTILSRLQTGSVSIENNIDKIFEYLRIMSNRKATSAVIPPVALRRLLLRIEDRMRANPRLRLPYDPRAGEIWKYYGVTKVTPIVMDKMLVILMTIPVLDKTLELNIYQVHNLPAIPPGQEVESLYQLENKYFAIGRHGLYVTLPTEQSVRICLQTELAICILEQALYPVEHITWCVYALFIDDEPCIKRDCKYTVSKVSGNRAISLGGYLWAISSIEQEQLQVRCLEETHMIEIQPPLQIVYLGNGCEGYSPSMFLPAKNEMTTHAQIESRREYFLQFNYVYTPDKYIGLWWQFRTRMMSEKEARAFITQVAPLGTMDYSLLHKRPPMIKTNYGFSWPVPPATLVVGVIVIILLIAGIALGCYMYRMRKTFSLAAGTIKKVTDKPLSGCCRLFSRMHKRTRPVTSPRTIPRQRTIEDTPEAHAAEIHPVQMTKILRDVFQDPQLVHKYAKHLDKKVQVDSFTSQEPEIVPDPENPTDTLH